MAAGAALLGGLELAGPYMFLLMAGVGWPSPSGSGGCTGGPGGWRFFVAMIGVVMLLPSVSSADAGFSYRQAGLGRAGNDRFGCMIVWYLFQEPVREAFAAE